jgi:hypothetical protein
MLKRKPAFLLLWAALKQADRSCSFRTQTSVLVVLAGVLGLIGCGRSEPDPPKVAVEAAARGGGFAVRRSERLDATSAPRDTLRVQRVLGDSLSFARVVKLYHQPGRLLALDDLLSYHMASIDLRDGAVRHFGKNGEGPGEFRAPFSASFVENEPGNVWIYDFQLNRFSLIDLSGDEPSLKRTTPGPTGLRLLDPVVSNGVVSNVLSSDGVFAITSTDTPSRHRLMSLGTPFDSAAHPAQIARRLLNRTYMSPSPDRKRLAIAYQFTNRLEIVLKDGRHLVTAIGPREGRPSYRLERNRFFWNDDNVALYAGIAASERHIYLLYCGCRFADEQIVTRLHVFDWDGRFVREFAFDRHVGAIAVAPDDSALFGFADEPYPSIVEWKLPLAIRTRT